MPTNYITFQFATHYLPKKALHLECLFSSINAAHCENHPIIHHYALNNILSIIKFSEKPELKSRFLKELIRVEHILNKSQIILPDPIYAKLFVQIQVLSHLVGKLGGEIHQDVFLQSIQFIQPSHQADGELHAPQLLLWLEKPAIERQHDLQSWAKYFQPLYDTIHIYLTILREMAVYETIKLTHGYFQRSLQTSMQNTQNTTASQLILLKIDKTKSIIPKVQFGHHGLTLRIINAKTMKEHTSDDIDIGNIELAISQI